MTAVDDARSALTFTPVSAVRASTAALVPPQTADFAPVPAARADAVSTHTLVTPRASRAMENRQQWERRYRARLRITDTIIILISCAVASVVSLQLISPTLLHEDPWILARIPLVTALGWTLTLGLFNTRDAAVVGSGATEYRRVVHATAMAFGGLAILFVLFLWQGIRAQLFFALPVGLVLLLMSRWFWRKWLVRQRTFGRYASRAIVVGDRDDVEYVLRTLGRNGSHGYLVVGVALLDDQSDGIAFETDGYPVMRGASWVARISALEADSVIVASQPNGDPNYIKHLAWQVEGTAAELVISSRIADVAGPRMSLRPIEGLPLIHVKIPTFTGGTHVFKRVLDVAASFFALLAFSPIFLALAVAIKLDDRGPVFFGQDRVGRDGRTFKVWKFRSMAVDAEARLAELQAANEGSGLLFKMKDDPRITRVGKFIRRYSLDELPQFWNVLLGDMSVVGPRPPLPSEVTAYDGTIFRRLYIKPGITGPWQVGGRSDLSWEESVRLDLRYVENWSVWDDIIIMWRTAKVMVRPSGAY
ncbi:sugar transferase [Microbacterium sp.]|uniref:sugar transferase n=1 Tax=Microbacterium sp. TaxID=51671 RepID=UPI003F727C3F